MTARALAGRSLVVALVLAAVAVVLAALAPIASAGPKLHPCDRAASQALSAGLAKKCTTTPPVVRPYFTVESVPFVIAPGGSTSVLVVCTAPDRPYPTAVNAGIVPISFIGTGSPTLSFTPEGGAVGLAGYHVLIAAGEDTVSGRVLLGCEDWTP